MYCLFSVAGPDDDINSFFEKMDRRSAELGLYSQCLTPGCILGYRHLDSAFVNAVRNFSAGMNLTRSFSMEIMVMLSGQRQIREALDMFGLSPGSKIAILFSVSRKETDALMENFSLKKIEVYRRAFDGTLRKNVEERTLELMRDLELVGPENRGLTRGFVDFTPDRLAIERLLDLLGIVIPERTKSDVRFIERTICEKINLIHCR